MAMRFASCQIARLRLPVLITRPIEGLSLERELVTATVSGSTPPVEMRKIAQLVSMYERNEDRRSSIPPLWKLYSQRIGKLRPALLSALVADLVE
jgi:hypothetical protein